MNHRSLSKLSLDGISSSSAKVNLLFDNKSIVLRKETDALSSYYGEYNIILGYESGNLLKKGSDNIFIGHKAGYNTNKPVSAKQTMKLASTNLFIGSEAGLLNMSGYSNIYIGHNNSKTLTNSINNGINNEKIFDNISIGANSSSHGANTITLGNRTITNNAKDTTVIGFDSSNIGENTLIVGSKIKNTGDDSFILHSSGNINNDINHYFNLNDVFTGVTSNVDGNSSFINFNLDQFIIKNTLLTSNVNVVDKFISNESELNDVTITGYLESEGTSTFNDTVTFNSNLNIYGNVVIGEIITINNHEFNVNVKTEFTEDVIFKKNQRFTKDVIFDTDVKFNGDVKINKDTFFIDDKLFIEWISGNINIYDFIPIWVKPRQVHVPLSKFSNDLAPWLEFYPHNIDLNQFNSTQLFDTQFPWLKQNQTDIDLENFDKQNFAPWIKKDGKDIDISIFCYSNIVKNWIESKDQDEIYLRNFLNDDFIKEWVLEEQSSVKLSEFDNGDNFIKDWALSEQSNVNLSTFNNDHYRWLDDIHDKLSDTNDDNFTNVCKFIKTEIASWLRPDQKNITLSSFCNDLTVWTNNIYFENHVNFKDQVTFDDDQVTFAGFLTNGNNFLDGFTKLTGVFEVGDVFRIEGNNVHINGNLNLFDDLISIDFTSSNYLVNMDTELRSNLHVLYSEDLQSFVFEISENGTFIRENLNVMDLLIIDDNLVKIDSDLQVEGNVNVNDMICKSNIYIHPLDEKNTSWWRIYSESKEIEGTDETSTQSENEANLVFKSNNGALMVFHDNFEESIINFTGQHRCTLLETQNEKNTDRIYQMVGKIVVSTSTYRDLYDNSNIRINEAIPVVEIATKKNDKAVFGVISGVEDKNDTSTFSIGHISFILNKMVHSKKVMINSVGEGGIWICNINGDFENGDFITSSDIEGLGMRQNSDMRMNFTVAKITCTCTFDMYSLVYNCVEFYYDNQTFKKAFVGCVYAC